MPSRARPLPSTARTRCSRRRSAANRCPRCSSSLSSSSSRMLLSERRERTALRRPLGARRHQPAVHHPRLQIAANQAAALVCPSPVGPRAPSARRGSRGRRTSRGPCPPPTMARRDVAAGAHEPLGAYSVPVGSRSSRPRTSGRRSGSRTWSRACWINRSSTVRDAQRPRPASRPAWKSPRVRTGCGMYVPLSSCSRMRAQC